MVKGAASVNRVEIECQILCAALRQSLVRKDKVGAFTSIRELSYLFPDLLPPPEDKDYESGQKLNFYESISVKAQSGLNSIVVGYLRSVRQFLRQQSAKDNKQEYMNLLNAGFVLRKSRLRLSHDLVVTRRWLAETREVKKDRAAALEMTLDVVQAEAPLSTAGNIAAENSADSRQNFAEELPDVMPAVQGTSEHVSELSENGPGEDVAGPATEAVYNYIEPQETSELPPEEEAAETGAEVAEEWPEPLEEETAEAGAGAAGEWPKPQLEEEAAGSGAETAGEWPESQLEEEAAGSGAGAAGEWPESQPEKEVAETGAGVAREWWAPQPEEAAETGVKAAEEWPEPLEEETAEAGAEPPPEEKTEGNFVFDESQLSAKTTAEAPLPEIIRLMETARLIGVLEVQALRAQLSVAPNVAAEQLLLNAGYASQNEIASLHLAQHLLSSGKITIAQFQVAMYDERASGLRMAESLQVRGWLET